MAPSLDTPGQGGRSYQIFVALHESRVFRLASFQARDEIPPGTLTMLILRILVPGRELHGYEVAKSIEQLSEDILQVRRTVAHATTA
jgi:hypothetical protein